MCELIGMRKGVEVRLGPGDRERLDAVIGSGNSPQKHVWRARIVLLSADGLGTMAIQRQTGKGKPTIWRWQARFMTAGVDGVEMTLGRAAGRGDTLDRPGGGHSRRHQPSQRAADLGGARLQPHRVRRSSCRTTPSLPRRFRTSSASMSIRPSTRWCCRSMRRAKSRRSTAPSRGCQ